MPGSRRRSKHVILVSDGARPGDMTGRIARRPETQPGTGDAAVPFRAAARQLARLGRADLPSGQAVAASDDVHLAGERDPDRAAPTVSYGLYASRTSMGRQVPYVRRHPRFSRTQGPAALALSRKAPGCGRGPSARLPRRRDTARKIRMLPGSGTMSCRRCAAMAAWSGSWPAHCVFSGWMTAHRSWCASASLCTHLRA